MNKQYFLIVLGYLVFSWVFAQECLVPEEVPAGIADELTTGFPEVLDTPEKRSGVIADLLAKFSGYYDLETLKQDKTTFKEKAALASSEHDFYNVIREWVNELKKKDDSSTFTSAREINYVPEGGFQPYAGIGMSVDGPEPKPAMLVLGVRPDSPAFEAGLKIGDRIIAINSEPCPEIAKIIGEEGTPVTITVQSPNEEPRDLTLIRKRFETNFDYSLAYRFEDTPEIAYLYLADIDSYETDDSVREWLISLAEAGTVPLGGLIWDLRNSGGGSLNAVVKLHGHFFEPGPSLFAQQNALNTLNRLFISKEEPQFLDLPMVILTDESSSDTAVWLAAILKERSNTVLVGQPTLVNPFSYTAETLRDGSKFFFPTSLLVIRQGNEIKNEFVPLTDGRVAPDVLVEENAFPFSKEDTFVKVALEELAKLQGVSQ